MSHTPDVAPAHVSVVNEFPEDLYDAMRGFVRTHPHWDQYRLMQVAVAGFLFQQGSRERAVARHYLDGLFDRGGAPQAAGGAVAEGLGGPALRGPHHRAGERASGTEPAPRRETAGHASEPPVQAHPLPPVSAAGAASVATARRWHRTSQGPAETAA